MQPIDHARKLRGIANRIAAHSRGLARAQADLCAALTDAAKAAQEKQLITASETGEVIAPKDEEGN